MKYFSYIFFSLLLIWSCSDDSALVEPIVEDEHECTDICIIDDEIHNTNSKVWEEDGKRFLFGGLEDHMHFDITNWDFNVSGLHFGLGRETIEAIMEPSFNPIRDISQYPDEERCVIIRATDEIKVYPLATLRRHEVVNDVVDGEPVFVAYCLLADYVSVLSRSYCGKELTFAVSGFTYAEDGVWEGLQGFILWDRDTESLWWPLIDRGVSGAMKDVPLREYNITKWDVATWSDVVKRYPGAKILSEQQSHSIPSSWPKIPSEQLNCQ